MKKKEAKKLTKDQSVREIEKLKKGSYSICDSKKLTVNYKMFLNILQLKRI